MHQPLELKSASNYGSAGSTPLLETNIEASDNHSPPLQEAIFSQQEMETLLDSGLSFQKITPFLTAWRKLKERFHNFVSFDFMLTMGSLALSTTFGILGTKQYLSFRNAEYDYYKPQDSLGNVTCSEFVNADLPAQCGTINITNITNITNIMDVCSSVITKLCATKEENPLYMFLFLSFMLLPFFFIKWDEYAREHSEQFRLTKDSANRLKHLGFFHKQDKDTLLKSGKDTRLAFGITDPLIRHIDLPPELNGIVAGYLCHPVTNTAPPTEKQSEEKRVQKHGTLEGVLAPCPA
jgi:hypothetical protein